MASASLWQLSALLPAPQADHSLPFQIAGLTIAVIPVAGLPCGLGQKPAPGMGFIVNKAQMRHLQG